MTLSIIIVNWNTKQLLNNCLRSIYENAKKIDFEIIVIDNASSDNSVKMVKEQFPQVTLIENHKNLGFAKANNQGLKVAKGKYILFLNSDTQVISNAIEIMVDFMEKNPNIGASGCKLLYPNAKLQHSCRMFPNFCVYLLITLGIRHLIPNAKIFRRYLMLDWDYNEIREVDQLMGAFIMTSRKVINRIGGFDERFWMYFEEVDFCYRVKKANWRIVFNPRAKIIHYLSQSGKQWTRFKKTKEAQISMRKYFKKHHSWMEALILRLFSFLGLFVLQLFYWLKCYGWERKKGELSQYYYS